MKRLLLLLALLAVPASHAARMGGQPVALVTAETQNALIAVELPSGRILKRLPMPADPQNVEAGARTAVVVSTRAGAVTLVDVFALRIRKVIRGFAAPHIAALSPDGRYAYVTDDARGQLVVIGLAHGRVLRRLFVGLGAHHMAISPDGNRLWVALGERARAITIVDTARPTRPRIVRRLVPDGPAHDLAFSPGGNRVWVTHDDRSTITLYDARSGRPVVTLLAGRPPQHVTFSEFALNTSNPQHFAYVTSGYDGALRIFYAESHRLLRTTSVPYGSFNASSRLGLLATASLMRGTLAELDASPPWRRLRTARVAPAARDVALAVLP
jgi:DNA-binding beta-propeller fold protein YncE